MNNIEKGYFELRDVDPSFYSNTKLPAWLKKILADYSRNIVILDYGCGFGQTLRALKLEGFLNLYGLDIDNKAIESVKCEGFSVYNANEYKDKSIEFLDGKEFDICIMSHVLEHFSKDEMIPRLSKVFDSLKPTGKLILIVPNAQSNIGSYWRWEDFTHEWLFTSGSVKYVLKAAGFNKIEFVDVDSTEGLPFHRKFVKKFFLYLYKINRLFWNKITSSSYHKQSPNIYSYEIKVVAQK